MGDQRRHPLRLAGLDRAYIDGSPGYMTSTVNAVDVLNCSGGAVQAVNQLLLLK
jgi:hypothetical protein